MGELGGGTDGCGNIHVYYGFFYTNVVTLVLGWGKRGGKVAVNSVTFFMHLHTSIHRLVLAPTPCLKRLGREQLCQLGQWKDKHGWVTDCLADTWPEMEMVACSQPPVLGLLVVLAGCCWSWVSS